MESYSQKYFGLGTYNSKITYSSKKIAVCLIASAGNFNNNLVRAKILQADKSGAGLQGCVTDIHTFY